MPFVRAFAADAGLLHAAERRRRIGDQAAVEADHAEIELLGDAHAAAQVLGVEIGDETVFGVVGALDRLVLGLEGLDRGDRPEDFLVQHLGIVRHIGEHGRRIEEARARPAPCRRSAPWRLCSTASSTSSITLSRPSLLTSGPSVDAVVEAVAHLQRAHLGGELLGELVVHLLVHVEAVRRRAGLAHVAHLGDHRAVDRGIDIGVLEHDERRVAAELHRRLDDVVGGFVQQLAADLGRAGERDDAHARIVQHRVDHLARTSATE